MNSFSEVSNPGLSAFSYSSVTAAGPDDSLAANNRKQSSSGNGEWVLSPGDLEAKLAQEKEEENEANRRRRERRRRESKRKSSSSSRRTTTRTTSKAKEEEAKRTETASVDSRGGTNSA